MKGKKSSHKSVALNNHSKNAHAALSFLVLLLAFSILAVFLARHSEIISSGLFGVFIVLSAIGMSFLLGLLFLASPRKK